MKTSGVLRCFRAGFDLFVVTLMYTRAGSGENEGDEEFLKM